MGDSSWRDSATVIPRSLAMAGAEMTFTSLSMGLRIPARAAEVRGLTFTPATSPS